MPDFFLISGLFLARRIDVPWRDYFDKKVVHFLYFYFLWMTIQFLFKGSGIWAEQGVAGVGPRVCARLPRTLWHAVVHLSAARLLSSSPS